MPSRQIRLRIDDRLSDEALLLLRFNDDRDAVMALRQALLDAHLYRAVPGYEISGAVTVSTFIVRDEREAEIFTEGLGQSIYGLATAGKLRAHGYTLIGSDVLERGIPIPWSDRHVDLIVCPYPSDEPGYTPDLPPAQRRKVRELLIEQYDRALREFDPRRAVGEM